MGASIGYFSGDPLRLMEDAQILKPAMIPAVPRVFNRIYQGAMAAGDVPGLKGALFRYAVQTKLYWLRETGTVTHALWDRLVFRKVSAYLVKFGICADHTVVTGQGRLGWSNGDYDLWFCPH